MLIWNVDPGDLNPNQHPNPSPNLNLEDDALAGHDINMIIKGCIIIIWTGLNIKIGIVQKVYE